MKALSPQITARNPQLPSGPTSRNPPSQNQLRAESVAGSVSCCCRAPQAATALHQRTLQDILTSNKPCAPCTGLAPSCRGSRDRRNLKQGCSLAKHRNSLSMEARPPRGRCVCRLLLGSSCGGVAGFPTKEEPWRGRAAADSGAHRNPQKLASAPAPGGRWRCGCRALVECFRSPPPLTTPLPRGLEYHSFRTRLPFFQHVL